MAIIDVPETVAWEMRCGMSELNHALANYYAAGEEVMTAYNNLSLTLERELGIANP